VNTLIKGLKNLARGNLSHRLVARYAVAEASRDYAEEYGYLCAMLGMYVADRMALCPQINRDHFRNSIRLIRSSLKDPRAGAVMDRDKLLRSITEANWNVAAAARVIGVHQTTLRYRLQVLGIERPARTAPRIERHPPVAQLIAELEALRVQARVIVRTYLPGPARAAHLRGLEVQQRAIQARLRPLLGVAQ
jgi:hypothetical protein